MSVQISITACMAKRKEHSIWITLISVGVLAVEFGGHMVLASHLIIPGQFSQSQAYHNDKCIDRAVVRV